jgi:hypothetical protein
VAPRRLRSPDVSQIDFVPLRLQTQRADSPPVGEVTEERMRCPVCGGADRVSVELGYWECHSPVMEHRFGRIYNATDDETVTVDDFVLNICGIRYHDPSVGVDQDIL